MPTSFWSKCKFVCKLKISFLENYSTQETGISAIKTDSSTFIFHLRGAPINRAHLAQSHKGNESCSTPENRLIYKNLCQCYRYLDADFTTRLTNRKRNRPTNRTCKLSYPVKPINGANNNNFIHVSLLSKLSNCNISQILHIEYTIIIYTEYMLYVRKCQAARQPRGTCKLAVKHLSFVTCCSVEPRSRTSSEIMIVLKNLIKLIIKNWIIR